MAKILAIIPARGGSKGIKGKNIRLLLGKPLIAYTIEAALNSRFLDKVIVSTDSSKIAEISKKYKVQVIPRPEELAADTSPTEPCLLHVLEYLKENESYSPDLVVLLQPTSPLRGVEIIDACIKKIINEKLDSVLTVCEDTRFTWALKNKKLSANYNYKKRPRRQDYQPDYRENGAVYVTKTGILLKEKNRLGGKIGMVLMEPKDSIDIDNEFDFWLVEQMLRYRQKT